MSEPKHYGEAVSLSRGTNQKAKINQQGKIYDDGFLSLTDGQKSVMIEMLNFTDNGLNTVCMSGDTKYKVVNNTGFTDGGVKNAVTAIKNTELIEPTGVNGEYVINPILATKGDSSSVWCNYQKIESQKRVSNGNKPVPIHLVWA